MDHTAELESPVAYLRWAGLSTIAAVAQRKIFRDTQAYTVYPNMYVWLVGPPGTKKSTAVRSGRRLVKDIPAVYLTSDAPSIVGIMQDFKDVAAIQKDHQSLNGFILELSTLFENGGETMTGFLTAIYDGDADYVKRTRIGGKEHIPYPWFNMIAGTTPRWLGDNLSKNAVEGGLVARTLFIYSDEQNFNSPEPEITPAFRKREEVLTHDLAHITQIAGQFEWDGGKEGDAWKWYDTWYRNPERMPRIPDNRTQGYFVRKPMHLLKVATLLSLAKRDDKVYKIDDLVAALALLDSIENGMKRAFSAVGGNPYATDLERIGDQIKQSGGMTYAELIASNFHNLERSKLDMTLDSLCALGRIRRDISLNPAKFVPVDPV